MRAPGLSPLLLAFLLPVTLAPLAACGGDDDGAATSDGAPGIDGAAGADANPGGGTDATLGGADPYRTDLVGRVTVLENPGGTAYVTATFASGTDQPAERELAREGDCAIYEHASPGLCEGDCTGFCDEGGTCHPYPTWQDAGAVELRGLGAPITLEHGDGNFYSHQGAEDLFAPDDVLTVAASGAAFPAFALAARGVAELANPPAPIELTGDQPAIVIYTAGDGSARIQLALRYGWHGVPWETMLLCESEDDGSLDIPGSIVARMPEFGGIGLLQWPSELIRYSRTVVETGAGPVELFVGSRQVVFYTKE